MSDAATRDRLTIFAARPDYSGADPRHARAALADLRDLALHGGGRGEENNP